MSVTTHTAAAAATDQRSTTIKTAAMTSRLRLPNDRWKPLEILFWLMPVAAYFLFPGYLVLISQIMIIGLFAIPLT